MLRGFAWGAKSACLNRHDAARLTCLNAGFQSQIGVSCIAHFENASKPVLCQISDFENLQVRGYGTKIELIDNDIVDDDGRFGGSVQGCGQMLLNPGVEGGVRGQR